MDEKTPPTGRVHLARALIPVVHGHVERIAAVLAGLPDPGFDDEHPALTPEQATRALEHIWRGVFGHNVKYEQRMGLVDLVHLAATCADVADTASVRAYWEGLWPEIDVDPALFAAAVAAWRAQAGRRQVWEPVFRLLKSSGLTVGLARGRPDDVDDPKWESGDADAEGKLPATPWDQLRIRYWEWRRYRGDDAARRASFIAFLVTSGRAK